MSVPVVAQEKLDASNASGLLDIHLTQCELFAIPISSSMNGRESRNASIGVNGGCMLAGTDSQH